MAKLAKNISIYTVGNVLNRSITFILVPLYTRILVPSDYGKLELVNTVGAILAILYGLMVENGYSRVYFKDKDQERRKGLYFTGQSFNVLCCIIFGGFTFLYAESISEIIFKFPNGAELLRLVTIVTLFKVMTHIPINNIRIREKAGLFVMINAGYLLVNLLFTIYFLVVLQTGVKGILYAHIIAGASELIALYYYTWRESSFRFSFIGLQTMLGFSIFLIPSNLSGFVLNFSNRYFLNEYMNLEEVGLYSLGAKLSGVIPFLMTEPVKKAFGPHLYNLIDQPDRCKRQLADFTRYFFAGLAFTALFISLFSKEVISVMADSSYAGSHSIVFILSTSYLFLGLAGVIVIGIHISMKTWIVSIIWVISAVVNVLLNIILIPPYGRLGAAVATLLSVVFITTCYMLALQKVYPVKFKYQKYIYVALLMFMINYVSQAVDKYLMYGIIYKVILLIAFIIIILVSSYFTNIEKQKIIRTVRRWFSKLPSVKT